MTGRVGAISPLPIYLNDVDRDKFALVPDIKGARGGAVG